MKRSLNPRWITLAWGTTQVMWSTVADNGFEIGLQLF